MKNFRIIPKSMIKYRQKDTMWFDYFTNVLMAIISLLSFMVGWGKLINPYLSSFLTFITCIPAILYVSGKFNPFEGLADYQTKKDGQIAVIYGAFISGFGILQLTPTPYLLLEPTGTYGLAVLIGVSFIFAGIYIIMTTPILEPTPDIVEESYPEVVCHVSERTNEWNKRALERVWGNKAIPVNNEPTSVNMKPEKVKMTKIQIIRRSAIGKSTTDLSSQDIIREVEIDSDCLDKPFDYLCIEQRSGSILVVNRSKNKPFKLTTKQKVLILADQNLLIGTIQSKDGIVLFNSDGKVQQIQESQIIGSIDWILPV